MTNKLTGNAMRIISRTGIVVLFLIAGMYEVMAQDSCPNSSFPSMVQKKVAGITIPGTDMIHGYLEYLPPGYTTNTKNYPVLIFFHGVNETGSGSIDDLCKLLGQWWWTPSSNVELGRFPKNTIDPQGVSTQFIVITPQLVYFGDPNAAINSLLTYLLSKYRIDPSRVYLTGISAGANFIQTFVSNETSAKRIAAITPLSPCGYITAPGANVIARTNVGFWSVQCSTDFACNGGTAAYNANLINTQSPAPRIAAWATTFPVPGTDCWPFTHDTWSIAYDSTWRQTVNGRNVNLYEWMLQYRRAELLPVELKEFTATLSQGKVWLRWNTAIEWNNAGFEIERAGKDQRFSTIATIEPGEGNAAHAYEWVDDRPLPGLSFYRLVQKDIDGHRTYFEIRKILNQEQWARPVMVAPNPVQKELTVWVKLSNTQTLRIGLMDLNGRRLQTWQGSYGAGTSAINLNVGELPPGVYVVKVEGEGISVVEKVTKK